MESPEIPSDSEIELLRRKVYEHPIDLRHRFDFGVALYNRQKYVEAIVELQKAQQWPPTRLKAMRFLADAYDAKGLTDFATQIRKELSKESGDDGGDGLASVPVPKRPIPPHDSFRARKGFDEDDHAV
jgi:hypothetical protein